MRIVATSDTHYPFPADMIPNGDVLFVAGDLMYSGYTDEWYPRLKSLKDVDIKDKYLLPGNHDRHIELYEGVARAELRKEANTKLVGLSGKEVVNVNGFNVLFIPFVTGLPGWAFNRNEEWLDDYLEQFINTDIDIVVTHSPPYNILDAIYPEKFNFQDQLHVGTMAFNKWFYHKKNKPKVWICGHIHESYGRTTIDGCTFYNVAMCDRQYDQSNKPVVIDLVKEA